MSKKSLTISLITVTALFVSFVLWQLVFIDETQESDNSSGGQGSKQVIIASLISDVIKFNVFGNWNVFYNGDPELVSDLSTAGIRQSIVTSVSTADSPVTYTDMNWGQVDFLLTDGDLFTEQFINEQKSIEGQTFEFIELDNYEGYVLDDFDRSEPASKGNSDGLVYYLRPKVEVPSWNLIVIKQSKGSDEFGEGIDMILQTLEYQDYDEYVKELNK